MSPVCQNCLCVSIGIVVYVCILWVSDWHRKDLYPLMLYMLSSLGHKTLLSTSVKHSCIFLSRREGSSKGAEKQNWWNLGRKYSRSSKQKVIRCWILMLHLLLHNFTSIYKSYKYWYLLCSINTSSWAKCRLLCVLMFTKLRKIPRAQGLYLVLGSFEHLRP